MSEEIEKEKCHKCKIYNAEYNQTECEFCLGISEKKPDINIIEYLEKEIKRKNIRIERLNNIINELEKLLNYDINKAQEYMNKFIGEEQGNYLVHYYRAEWQKEKATIYLDKLQELKGSE